MAKQTVELAAVKGVLFVLLARWHRTDTKGLAKRLKIATRTLHGWEREGRSLWDDEVRNLARKCGCRPDWLLGRHPPDLAEKWRELGIAYSQGSTHFSALAKDLLEKDPPGTDAMKLAAQRGWGVAV